jgi:hypothetical protein
LLLPDGISPESASAALQWRQLRPVLDAHADWADLELRLIELLLKDRAPGHPFACNGGSWRKADVINSRVRPLTSEARDGRLVLL